MLGKAYFALGILAAAGAITGMVYLKGRSDGKQIERGLQREAVNKLNQGLRAKQAELKALEIQRLNETETLVKQINNLRREADEDANANHLAIGTNSVQRLNTVR